MASITIQLPIFIASPSDARQERDLAVKVVTELAETFAEKHISLVPRRWETGVPPGLGNPQDKIMSLLDGTELVVVILRSRLGSPARPESERAEAAAVLGLKEAPDEQQTRMVATLEEVAKGMREVRRGAMDDVFVYFWNPGVNGQVFNNDREEVELFKSKLAKSYVLLYKDYKNPADFQFLLRKHISDWLNRWERLPEIVFDTITNVPPTPVPTEILSENLHDRLGRLLDRIDATTSDLLGEAAVRVYQQQGPQVLDVEVTTALRQALEPYGLIGSGRQDKIARRYSDPAITVTASGAAFSNHEWYFMSCAHGLASAIEGNRPDAVESVEYVNPVHQLLRGIVLSSDETRRRSITNVLRAWLQARTGPHLVPPTGRNFAAYVLGMIEARDAIDDLIAALDDPGKGVAYYAISALGKLRARRAIPKLTDKYFHEKGRDSKLLVGQALCRIIGIHEYQL